MSPDTLRDEAAELSQRVEGWKRLSSARTREDYFHAWLGIYCSMAPSTTLGLVVPRDDDGASYEPVAQWPTGTHEAHRLAEISQRVIEARTGLLSPLEGPVPGGRSSSQQHAIAYPILVGEELRGAASVSVATAERDEIRGCMEQLQWAVSWLELWFLRQQGAQDGARLVQLQATVDLLATVMSEPRADAACMAFVTELANRFQLDRASFGFVRDDTVSVRAVSHTAQFREKMNLNRALAAAMDEAVVQRRAVSYPVSDEAEVLVTRDHELLAQQQGGGSILSVPLFEGQGYYAALTLERPEDRVFDTDEVTLYSAVASLAGPVLEAKRLRDRPLLARARDSLHGRLAWLMGTQSPGWKLAGAVLLVLALYVSFAESDYRLPADMVLEGEVQRVLVAPFDGYLSEAAVRAGDIVVAGDVMCRLDDRDLRLEQLKWLSQQSQLRRRHQEALASQERVQVNVVTAQLDQLQAQLELNESRLARTRVQAPFDGIVVSGDLSQRLGGAVQQGEVLFQVAPLDAYRVILKVPEDRIRDVEAGQRGSLVLAALPEQQYEFSINKITPISWAEEGRSHFRVEASLDQVTDRLRPGMEGVAKILVDRRRIITLWTRSMREWLHLWIWRWWP